MKMYGILLWIGALSFSALWTVFLGLILDPLQL